MHRARRIVEARNPNRDGVIPFGARLNSRASGCAETERTRILTFVAAGNTIVATSLLSPPHRPRESTMILDRLENAGLYRPIGANIAAAFDYLRRTDFSQIAAGRYELDGERLFAIVQRYRPKALAQIVWEAHRQYIDVQYLAAGSERMGYLPLTDGLDVRQPYDPQKDAILFHAEGQLFTMSAGDFAVFAPCDVHAPCLATDAAEEAAEVCKVVVKCRVK
jgi:YhcH/YjgK/YiaL family protein